MRSESQPEGHLRRGASLSALVESLFETFPSDDGSRMLSTVMTDVAVERGLINSANPRLEKGLARVRRLRGTFEVEYLPDVVGQPDPKITEAKTL